MTCKSDKINWGEIRGQFEEDMAVKLNRLPGHREVPKELFEFRSIISHELPETSSAELFKEMMDILLREEKVNPDKAREKYLNPELERERKILEKFKTEVDELRESARNWIKKNFTEEQLQSLWKEHKTWLPRRYTIYDKQLPFQEIAADTLARYKIIRNL